MNRDSRQAIVSQWVRLTFGTASDTKERARRLVEETIELAQAEGLSEVDVMRIVCAVFVRPAGHPIQEAGGVGVTLLAYCAAIATSADRAEANEVRRVMALPAAHFRERQVFKAAAGIAAPVPKKGK